MTGEEFLSLWSCTELRQFIVDEAKNTGKTESIRCDMIASMWIAIAESPADMDVEAYKALCHNCIHFREHR